MIMLKKILLLWYIITKILSKPHLELIVCSSTKHEDILIGLWFFNDLANLIANLSTPPQNKSELALNVKSSSVVSPLLT